MTKRSAPSTPTRSSVREPKKTPHFQINNTPKSGSHARTPLRASANFKKIVGHEIYDEFYVEYEVELNNGSTMKVTEFDFKKAPKILQDYQEKVTGQTDDNSGEYDVEKILTHRVFEGKTLYLIQWKGFPHPVWRSELYEEELGNCEKLIKDYHLKLRKTPTKSAGAVKSTKKRAIEEVELTESTPQKIAKKPLASPARSSRTRTAIIAETTEEQQDEDDVPEEHSIHQEVQDDDEEEEHEEQATAKKGGVGWLFNPFNWF